MTRKRDFKALVRQRMEKTGERYATARAHVLAARTPGAATGSPSGLVGGQQADVAAARNFCTAVGVLGPDGTAMTEAMAFGLAGGVGFLYGVFEYGDTPTMTIVARNQSMPDPFLDQLFTRLDLEVEIKTTGGAKKAATDFDDAVEKGLPILCTVGAGFLPYLGLPRDEAAMSPHVVGVIGVSDDGGVLLDDRSPNPIRVDRVDFDEARAAYRQAKHRMVLGRDGLITTRPDWERLLEEAVVASAAGFDTPPVPQFKSNVGIVGLTKWQDLLTSSTKKGWATVFGSDRRAAIGLTRLYDCVNHAYTAPDAGRPLFADFLGEAVAVTGQAAWKESAELWAESGRAWRSLSELVVAAHPDLERYGQLSDERADVLDTADGATADMIEPMAELAAEQRDVVESFSFGSEQAADLHHKMADVVGTIIDLESEALDLLR